MRTANLKEEKLEHEASCEIPKESIFRSNDVMDVFDNLGLAEETDFFEHFIKAREKQVS